MANALDKYVGEMTAYLKQAWGLNGSFAERVALLYLYACQYGLNPKITSGYRSAEKQAELSARYSAGDRSVVVKPAVNSKHSIEGWLGNPASEAIDIVTNNPGLMAQIATALKIGAGLYFKTPDSVHFYQV